MSAAQHSAVPWSQSEDGLQIAVRLTPKGGRDAVDGIGPGPDGPVLKVRVRAAPSDGAANAALIKMLAKVLDVPKSAVRLVRGAKSRTKSLAVSGRPGALCERLQAVLSASTDK